MDGDSIAKELRRFARCCGVVAVTESEVRWSMGSNLQISVRHGEEGFVADLHYQNREGVWLEAQKGMGKKLSVALLPVTRTVAGLGRRDIPFTIGTTLRDLKEDAERQESN